jgi:hypothetical protein
VKVPEFDELIGNDVSGAERERLRRAHELLLIAGQPPELAPDLERGPTLAMTMTRPKRQIRHRATVLLAAAVAIASIFLAGYATANHGGGTSISAVRTLKLHGDVLAPNATALLAVQAQDEAGNSPMTLVANGLPQPPQHGYYSVWLFRNGKPWGPCGEFTASGAGRTITVSLTAPYELEKGDTWVVKLWTPGTQGLGRTVMSGATA